MDQQKTIDALNASPIYRYGCVVRKYLIRASMLGAIVAIFFSPATTLPKAATASETCESIGKAPCGGPGPDCGLYPSPVGRYCTLSDAPPGTPAPEMPAVLVPLFILVASGMAYSIRRKALVRA
jgi:hypothetical protein